MKILKRIMLSKKGGLAVKKLILPILMLTLIAFFTAGCGNSKASTVNSQPNDSNAVSSVENKVSESQNPSTPKSAASSVQNSSSTTSNSTSISTSNSASTTKASNEASTSKMQDVSNLMDQIDATIKGLDNSTDISNLESTINNIK